MFEKFRLWWRFDGRYMHREFARGVKNLWRWFPVIWRDRDWDQDFIYSILAKKLEFQAKYIGDRDWHVVAKRDAEIMRLVVKLIRLQQEDFYGMEYMDYEETKVWFEPCNDTSETYELKSETISEQYDAYFAKYPLQYKRVLNGEGFLNREIDPTDKHLIAMSIAHLNQDRCKELLFKIISDHIDGWWD